tara:strand:- start:92 stop:460 length:369 start_codon:yes stop_codon:yes gene_type:complete
MGRIEKQKRELIEESNKRMLNEYTNKEIKKFDDTSQLKITKAVFGDDFYVTLSNGLTYRFKDTDNAYSSECKSGEWTGETLPEHCVVDLPSVKIRCTNQGCKNTINSWSDKITGRHSDISYR